MHASLSTPQRSFYFLQQNSKEVSQARNDKCNCKPKTKKYPPLPPLPFYNCPENTCLSDCLLPIKIYYPTAKMGDFEIPIYIDLLKRIIHRTRLIIWIGNHLFFFVFHFLFSRMVKKGENQIISTLELGFTYFWCTQTTLYPFSCREFLVDHFHLVGIEKKNK